MAVSWKRKNEIWDLCERAMKGVTSASARNSKVERELDNFFENATAEDLHEFVSSWNWDAGLDRIWQTIENPHCDAATLLKTFWLNSPEFFLEYETRDEVPDYLKNNYDLVCEIEQLFLAADISSSKLSYRPKRLRIDPNWKRTYPPKMYEPMGKPWWIFW